MHIKAKVLLFLAVYGVGGWVGISSDAHSREYHKGFQSYAIATDIR